MRQEYYITGSSGFHAKNYDPNAPMNSFIRSSVGFWFSPEGVLESHAGALEASSQLAGDVAFPFGDGYGTIGVGRNDSFGNAVKYVGNAALFVTNNDVKIYDPSLSSGIITIPFTGLTSGIPYIAPYKGSGAFRTPVPLGVAEQIDAPSLLQPLATASGFTGLNNGLYALRLSYIRTFTGGETLTSPSSNSVTFTNSSVVIQFPEPTQGRYVDDSPLAWDTNDVWRLYPTPKNFGNTTVFVFLKDVAERRVVSESYGAWTKAASGSDTEITLTTDLLTHLFSVSELQSWLVGKTVTTDGAEVAKIIDVTATNKVIVAGSLVAASGASLTIKALVDGFSEERLYETEWSENDLSDLVPPTTTFPPNTDAKFVLPLVNVVLLVGTDGGQSVASSVQNFPESYPSTFRMVLPETPIGISAKSEDAYAYILCRESTHEVRWTGATDGAPVALRKISTKGTAAQKAFTVVDGNIFSFTPDRNIVLIEPSGSTDTKFSAPVIEIIKDWTPELVVVSYDLKHNAVVFFHKREFLPFHLDYGVWGSLNTFNLFSPSDPNIPNNDIATAITYKGIIHLFDIAIKVISSTGSTTTDSYVATTGAFSLGDIGSAILLRLADGSIWQATIMAVSGFGSTAHVASLPTNFQSLTGTVYAEITDGSPTAYYFDRAPDGRQAASTLSPFIRYQWNHFDRQLYGKTIRSATVIATGMSGGEISFVADGNTTAMGPNYPISFATGDFVSYPIDVNDGIGRMIGTSILATNVSRMQIHGVRLSFTTTKLFSRF
jgi:hypothetical protein